MNESRLDGDRRRKRENDIKMQQDCKKRERKLQRKNASIVNSDSVAEELGGDVIDEAPSDSTNREPVVETVVDDNDESDAEIVDMITPPRHHDNTMHRCPPTLNKVRDHISYVPSTPGPIVHPITNQPIFDEECDSPPTFLAKLNETEHDVEDEEMQVSTMKGM